MITPRNCERDALRAEGLLLLSTLAGGYLVVSGMIGLTS